MLQSRALGKRSNCDQIQFILLCSILHGIRPSTYIHLHFIVKFFEGVDIREVQETVESHLKDMIIKCFDPKKADSIFTVEGEVSVLDIMIPVCTLWSHSHTYKTSRKEFAPFLWKFCFTNHPSRKLKFCFNPWSNFCIGRSTKIIWSIGLHMGPNNLCYVTRHFLFFSCVPMSLFIRPWRHFLQFL